MIKPIVYHSFEEKEALERKLLAEIPVRKRLSISKALMNIFYISGKSKQNPSTPSGNTNSCMTNDQQ